MTMGQDLVRPPPRLDDPRRTGALFFFLLYPSKRRTREGQNANAYKMEAFDVAPDPLANQLPYPLGRSCNPGRIPLLAGCLPERFKRQNCGSRGLGDSLNTAALSFGKPIRRTIRLSELVWISRVSLGPGIR